MRKFMDILENQLMPLMVKLAEHRYLKATRSGIVITMPLVIVGSLFLILLNIPIETAAFSWNEFITPYFDKLIIPFRLTVGVMALYAAFGIGAALGQTYKLDEVTSGVLATLGFLCTTIPINLSNTFVEAVTANEIMTGVTQAGNAIHLASGDYLILSSLGSAGLFGSIIASIISVEIYRECKKRNLMMTMPKGVPAAVAHSFASLVPTFFIVLLFWMLRIIIDFDVNVFITQLLAPISSFISGNHMIGIYLVVILITLFWATGLHGVALIGSIASPFWEIAITENMNAFAIGAVIPNLYTEQFLQWFVWIGGSGATIGLAILMTFFAKSQYLKQLGKISFIPSIFNVNEPIIFGAPIVMNPVLIVPFIGAPIVLVTISSIALNTGLIGAIVTRAPWTLPGPIGAAVSVGTGHFFAFILCMINIVIAAGIYFPFFKVYDNQLLTQENTSAKENG
ncbi:MAG: PTS sugar transporter subunit IIC [Culicoidibacterales bacterium]